MPLCHIRILQLPDILVRATGFSMAVQTHVRCLAFESLCITTAK